MADTPTLRALFQEGDVSTRLRRLALNLEMIGLQFADGLTIVGLEARIDESFWMIDCIAEVDNVEVVDELADLRCSLEGWRGRLVEAAASTSARAEARDWAGAWADRLLWVSALLEATG